jgi:hypothetical protein
MKKLLRTYTLPTLAFVLVSVILVTIYEAMDTAHVNPQFWSGWLLFNAIIFLAAYNFRKKISVPRLIASRHWLKLHIAVALIGITIFFLHVGARVPKGMVEQLLAFLWLSTTLSGILGLFFTRILPRRLTAEGEEVILELIPEHRRQLLLAVEGLAEESIEQTQFTTVAFYFTEFVRDFFYGPKNTIQHIFGESTAIDHLLRHIETKKQFLSENEKGILSEIAKYAVQKDKLDYHYALQTTLKLWLFVHIPLTYTLITTALLHIVLVYVFSGSHL